MTAFAVLCAALAAWLWRAPPPEPRLRLLMRDDLVDRRAGSGAPSRGPSTRLPVLAALLGAAGAVILIGGIAGVAAAVACVVLVPRLARRLESRGTRRRREELERVAPDVADLLAATLASGSPPSVALTAVAAASGAAVGDALRPVLAAIGLGADPAVAWTGVDPVLRPIAVAMVRSAQSGAPLSEVLARVAEDLRRDRQQAIEVAARSAGVRAVVPLSACFLPAFVLVGVVPVVVSLATGLLG